jgi:hypothetical protein
MKSPEEIEQALQRLVPPALSSRAHANVSAMIASLAEKAQPAAEVVDFLAPARKFPLRQAAAAAVAIAALALMGIAYFPTPDAITTALPTPVVEKENSPVLIDRMELTDGMTVEGTLTAADGTIMNQVKRRVETHERYRDTQKGYLITVSETRDEKVLLPKRGF